MPSATTLQIDQKNGFYKAEVKISFRGNIKYLSYYDKKNYSPDYFLEQLNKMCIELTGEELGVK